MSKVVGYVRVSTDKQADSGVSLDAQRRKLELYAELHDLELVEIVVDAGESAKTLDRPGLQRCLEMLRTKEVGALLVAKLDRLTRSVRDMGDLVATYFGDRARHGAELLSVSDQIDTRTAAGRLVLNVLMSVSQWEREAIGERTSTAMQYLRAQGRYTGGKTPFGYDLVNGELVQREDELETAREARRLRAGGLSLRAISGRLAGLGRMSRAGRPFSASAISGMLVTS
jgi:DNA invertase Pin-like site-specific DNA recombinase